MQNLSDFQIEKQLQHLIKSERATLYEVLVHIREVDARKIYLRRARGSLWEYLIHECRYSPAAAQRRIDSVRLSFEIPQVLAMLKEGKLNLFLISTLQKGVRQKEKIEKVPTPLKLELLKRLEQTHFSETEGEVAKFLGLRTVEKTSFKTQPDDSVRLALTLTKESWASMEKCREILSHVIPSGSYPEILERVLKYFVEKQDLFLRTITSESEVKARHNTGALPKKLRLQILQRDKVCQYIDPETRRVCGSAMRLQVDHIKMRCQGGTNDPTNLRVLCAAHNRLAAIDALSQ